MAAKINYLAFDLGASGGRAMLGRLDQTRLTVEEIHRFENRPVAVTGKLYWNALSLFDEIKAALGVCTRRGVRLDSIGIDTWGVDFALLGPDGVLLEPPRHYRDPRTRGVMERVLERVPRERIYGSTGIQFMPFNTLYQLAAVRQTSPHLLDAAGTILFMPDLFLHWLGGEPASEPTIASTSQMLRAGSRDWDTELLELLGLPVRIVPPIRRTGSPAGRIRADVAAEVGQSDAVLVRTAGHDTGAAVAAVPAIGEQWAYVSSGTWSLVGVELSRPLISPEARDANFTNEAGVDGTTRFLRNVAGLWLVQECQRVWAASGRALTHEELVRQAAAAAPLRCWVDPDDPRFLEPGDMPQRICQACGESGQVIPDSPGAIARCVFESLALKCRHVLETLERLTGKAIEIVHIVGGGARNELLNQFIADATGRPVRAGPAEATAVGNLLVQAFAHGRIASLAELREVVARSFAIRDYEPHQTAAWQDACGRFPWLLRGRQ